MLQNLPNFAKFQKFQFDNLVDFEKCCKTHIFLQKSVPIQPKMSNILPKFCQKLESAAPRDPSDPLEAVDVVDGDGTVPTASLRACERWARVQDEPVLPDSAKFGSSGFNILFLNVLTF